MYSRVFIFNQQSKIGALDSVSKRSKAPSIFYFILSNKMTAVLPFYQEGRDSRVLNLKSMGISALEAVNQNGGWTSSSKRVTIRVSLAILLLSRLILSKMAQ